MARILFIDDEPDLRVLMAENLVFDGHDVRTAANGRQGLEIVDRFVPDIVITDIFMPEVDGIEVILTLAQRHPDIRVIATSRGGHICHHRYLDEAVKFGAIAVIDKPFFLKDLQALLDDVLGQKPSATPTPAYRL